MIRSVKLNLKHANSSKLKFIESFVDEYKRCAEIYVDYIWNNKFTCGDLTLDVSNQIYDFPQFISTSGISVKTFLSGRATKSCSNQAYGIIKSVLRKRVEEENLYAWKIQHKIKDEKLEQILSNPPTKPIIKNMMCDLDTNTVYIDQKKDSRLFDYWLDLHSMVNLKDRVKHIKIPLYSHKQLKKWLKQGKLLNGISIGKNYIRFNIDIPTPKVDPIITKTIAIDQGLSSVITTNDGFTYISSNNDWIRDWDLKKILELMCRKKKGTKAFKRAEDLRKNYINFVINKLREHVIKNNINEVKLEKIRNIKYGRKSSRMLSHWSNPLIRDSIEKMCEEIGVLLTYVSNPFNSQRCNKCGWVQKSNRKQKSFCCKHCNHTADADENAAHNINDRSGLPDVPFWLIKSGLNVKGFFWNIRGFYKADGENLQNTVPHDTERFD